MNFVQMTDLHLLTEGQKELDYFEPYERAAEALRLAESLDPAPLFLLLTGDLANRGRVEEYQALKSLLDTTHIPSYLVMGNHDSLENLRQVFPSLSYDSGDEFLDYYFDMTGIRFIVLDSRDPNSHGGLLSESQISWLDKTLTEAQGKAVLALHHIPVAAGMLWSFLDREWAKPLGDVISRHRDKTLRILCGHTHRSIFTSWNQVPLSCAASATEVIACNCSRTSILPEFSGQKPEIHWHHLYRGSLVTHPLVVDPEMLLIDVFPKAVQEKVAQAISEGENPEKVLSRIMK